MPPKSMSRAQRRRRMSRAQSIAETPSTSTHLSSPSKPNASRAKPRRSPRSTSTTKETPVYFWHEEATGYLAQWYPSHFSDTTTDITYKSAEHYLMHRKALHFSAPATLLSSILSAGSARKVKGLGRSIQGFDEKAWADVRYQVAKEGNLLKFRGKKLRKRLLETGESELAEASPFDRVWGTGYRAEEVRSVPRAAWGMNLLGKVLMEVRGIIRAEEEEGKGEGRRDRGGRGR